MPRYPNGQIPASALVTFASGTNEDGYWEHQLPPSTYRKHLALVRLGQERRGRTLQITPGYNAYRPIASQWVAFRNEPAGNAAYPGTSSHGGSYQGTDMAAADYGNWQWVWGSFDAFAAACREVGLEAGLFPWEPWHVIDRDPWAPVLASLSISPAIAPQGEENAMLLARREATNAAYAIYPTIGIKHVPSADEERLVRYLIPGDSDMFSPLSDPDLSVLLWATGFPELGGDVNKLPAGGAYYWAPARQ